MNFMQHYKNFLTLFIIYFISNIFLLLNYNGIYWDDYAIYHQTYTTIKSMFAQASGGLDMATYIHTLLLSFDNGVFLYRFLTFILYFLSAIFFYHTLRSIHFLDKNEIFLITLIYLVVPVFSARIALINFPYVLSLFLFNMAFLLLTHYMQYQRSFLYRIGILLLFAVSFMTASLLVFYGFVLLYILYANYIQKRNFILSLRDTILKYIDFIALPLIFFEIKNHYFKPYGLYASYNQINIDKNTLTMLYQSFEASFVEPLSKAFYLSIDYWYIFIVLFIFLYRFINKFTFNKKSFIALILLLLFGIFIFSVAVFPYIAVGKLPQLIGWESRHQLLIPFGFSLILVSLYLLLRKLNIIIANLSISIVISMFTVATFDSYLRYEKDWFYQLALEKNMKASSLIQNNSTFIIQLINSTYLANHRNISFYEFGGHNKKVFGIDNKLFVENINDIRAYKQYQKHKQYNFAHWNLSKPLFITIEFKNMNGVDLYLILYHYITNQNNFDKTIKQYVTIRGENSEHKTRLLSCDPSSWRK